MSYLRYLFTGMRRKKARTILGILGIIVSVALLTGMNATVDSYSYSYIDQAEQNEGIIDFMITRNTYDKVNPGFEDAIFLEAKPRSLAESVDGVQGVSPRLRALVEVEVIKKGTEQLEIDLELIGMDFDREQELGIGQIRIIEGEFDLVGKKVFIQRRTADLLSVEVGDKIRFNPVEWNKDAGGRKGQFFEVSAIIEDENRLADSDNNAMICGLWSARDLLRSSKYVTELVGVFENRDFLYDIREIDATVSRIVKLGTRIQDAVGIEYNVELPITEELQQLDQQGVFIRIILGMVAVISLVISCVLMYSLLTISVEEKTHDFGLFMAIGAKKKHIYRLVILEAVIIAVLGTVVGVVLGFLLSLGLLYLLTAGGLQFLVGSVTLQIIVTPTTIAMSIVAGIAVGLISSIYPAMKVTRVNIVDSLTPMRGTPTYQRVVRERGVSSKLITYGFIISGVSGFVFFIFPTAFITMDLSVIGTLFLGMMLALLLGFDLIGLGGLVPSVEKLLVRIIRPFTRRINDVVAMYLKKHRRRNTLTAIMYSVSIAFILFLSTMLTVQTLYNIDAVRAEVGTDLALVSTTSSVRGAGFGGGFGPGTTSDIPIWINDTDLVPKIKEINGVVAITRVSPENHPNGSSTVRMGDLIMFEDVSASVYAVDADFPNVTFFDIARFTEGDVQAFKTINEVENTTIISEGAAKRLQVHVGDKVRIQSTRNLATGREVLTTELTVVALASDMPAFSGFQERESGFSDVLVSQTTYALIFNLYEEQDIDRTHSGELEDYVEPVDRLLIQTTTSEASRSVALNLRRSYSAREGLNVIVVVEEIEEVQRSLLTLQLFFTIALGFGMVIALFGLTASCYTTIQESIREIGIMKSVGLKRKHITNIFMFESIILTMAAGLSGTFVGYFTGLSLIAQQSIFTEQPLPLYIPWLELGLVIVASIIIGAIGAWIPSRIISKKNTAEILRMR
ncbi:ABC transporter permease [Candidatus Borrarchaeum sp.]|uniref:ABC transporter permease n=1 Tax=Candidatus Borrarchaeum sp. TaxID=2846742 RepID=UPI00257E698F|nr:FtsX-like permease family protein [Candidatus Borrarchaeum sp.]